MANGVAERAWGPGGRAGRRAGVVPGPLGVLLARLYGAEIARRNRRFDAHRGVVTLDRPVISVGNLSVGGTGKTPMVMRVVRRLQGAGHRPCIAMRGYGAQAGSESDEAAEYAAALPGVPVVARADRLRGLIELFGSEEGERIDTIVLDDGFQHRRIARALDLVLVDASRDPFADGLLPAGWLREPVAALRRADAVVLTHAELVDPAARAGLEEKIATAHGRAVLAVARHEWAGLRDADGAERPVGVLRGRRVFGVCAVGNPEGFLRGLGRAAGRDPAGAVELRDHDPYRPETVRRVVGEARAAGAEFVVTTEKDWAKLRRVARGEWPCPVVRPVLELRFDRGEAELEGAVLAAGARSDEDDGAT